MIRPMEKGVPIRALSRGIAVLQALNQGVALSMMQIARACCMPYPTACRIVQTFVHEGLVEREPTRKRYRPTALVQTLAHGFQEDAVLVRAARPHIMELTAAFDWPITLSTRVGPFMVIRDSTHALTSLTFNYYYPGYRLPILESAAGIVTLAFMPREQRQGLLDSIKRLPQSRSPNVIGLLEQGGLVRETVANGYAKCHFNQFTRNPGKTSSLAVPIMAGDGDVAGAVTLAFFSSAIRMGQAERKFVGPLKNAAAKIGDALASSHQDWPDDTEAAG